MNFIKESGNGKRESLLSYQANRTKKIKIGEQFKDCFKFTLKLKEIKTKVNSLEDKILDKMNKTQKLPNQYIKQLCNFLKTRDIDKDRKRKIMNEITKTNTKNPSNDKFQKLLFNKEVTQVRKKELSHKCIYSYNVLKIINNTAVTSLVESDLNKLVTSPSLEVNDFLETYTVTPNPCTPRGTEEKYDNNLFLSGKKSFKFSSIPLGQISSRDNLTKHAMTERTKTEFMTHYPPSKSKSKCQLFKESDKILSSIDFIDNRRNKILNNIIKKNTVNTIRTKKSKYIKTNE